MKKRKSGKPRKQAVTKTPSVRRVHWASLKAIGLFGLYSGIGFWLLFNPSVNRGFVEPYTDFVARSTGWIFRVFGADAFASGTVLTLGGTSFSIAFGCNGLEALAIYMAAMLASPFYWKSKITGLIVGFAGNFIINQIRIIGLFLAAMIGEQQFEYAHTIIGQTFVIVLTMALFLWWGHRYGQRKKTKPKPVLA